MVLFAGLLGASLSSSFADETGAGSGAALLRKLINKEPVTYVALGDSITFGYELPRTTEESFATQFLRILTEAFHDPHLHYVNAGVAGEAVDQGLNRLPALLKKYHPDLMTVQFGGNDYRSGTPVSEFERDLTEIVETARQECNTGIILVTPPMASDAPEHDSSMVKAVRRVAKSAGAPVVDSDTLLKEAPHDFRGLFPVNAHPTAYSHREMARALWREFVRWTGSQAPVEARIRPVASIVDLTQPLIIPVQLTNLTDQKQTCQLVLTVGQGVQRDQAVLQPKEERHRVFAVFLPDMLVGMRSSNLPVRLGLWTDNGYTCDVKNLSINPVVVAVAPNAGQQERFTLDFSNITVGKYSWDGPSDLSAAFHVTRNEENVQVLITVVDDLFVPAPLAKPFDGDSVEICLDLRKPEEQGQLFFTRETIMLYVIPNPATSGTATILTSEPEPKKLTNARATSTRTGNGYELKVDIPLGWFEAHGKDSALSFGFDVAVNDGDDRSGRETQMTWAGSELNYLNPSLFGALTLQPTTLPNTARVTIQ